LPHPSLTGHLRRFLAATTAVSALGGLVLGRLRWRQARGRLLDLEVEGETAEVRERLRAAEADAHRHDLINAYAAIEGAAMILEGQTFEAADRAKLQQMLALGVGHFRDLLDPRSADADRVSLAAAAAELAQEPAWHGQLHLDVAPDLVATGSPGQTKEAVRQVLGYVGRRASAERLTVRGQRAGEWVGLWVDDSGIGLSRRQQRARFDLKGDRPLGPDFPMALHVAARLMRGQGGELRVEARGGGVLSVGVCLPAAPEEGG
jgi:signal transduction histidine kinase